MKRSNSECSSRGSRQRNSKGQVAVEYVLILVMVIAIATFLVKELVGSGAGENDTGAGSVLRAWARVIRFIGEDPSDGP